MIIIFTLSMSAGQEIVWPDNPGPVTALSILCDTKNIPIYIDGEPVGISPLSGPIQVAPGWHQVSYFPSSVTVHHESPSAKRKMNDIINLARQDVLVEKGKTVKVVLSYRSIEYDVEMYQRKFESSKWVGFAIMILTMTLFLWGLT